MKIEIDNHNNIKIISNNGGFIETQSVEAILMYKILQKLEEIRCGIIDVENEIKDI
jgi:hypothetical protein